MVMKGEAHLKEFARSAEQQVEGITGKVLDQRVKDKEGEDGYF